MERNITQIITFGTANNIGIDMDEILGKKKNVNKIASWPPVWRPWSPHLLKEPLFRRADTVPHPSSALIKTNL